MDMIFPWDFPWEFPLFIGYQLSNLSNPDAFQAAAPGGLAETSIARCLTWQRSSWHPHPDAHAGETRGKPQEVRMMGEVLGKST